MKSVHSIAVLSAVLLSACGGGSDQASSTAPRVLSGGISTAAASACPAWTATAVYTAGMCAIYQGKQYEAKWWVQGAAPNPTDAWGPWKYITDAPDPTTPPDPGTPQPGGVPTKAQAEAREAQLTNNDFFRTVKASIRTLDNAAVDAALIALLYKNLRLSHRVEFNSVI